jgi:hypothetical protein
MLFIEELILAACLSRHPTVANCFTVDLARLEVVTEELADLFGLTLPIPLKRQAHKTAGYQLAAEPHVTTHPGGLVGPASCISML